MAPESGPPARQLTTDFGGHSGGVTPVPIPNTEVKPSSADGTWDVRPWESRTPPDFEKGRRMSASPSPSPDTVAASPSRLRGHLHVQRPSIAAICIEAGWPPWITPRRFEVCLAAQGCRRRIAERRCPGRWSTTQPRRRAGTEEGRGRHQEQRRARRRLSSAACLVRGWPTAERPARRSARAAAPEAPR